MKKENNKKKKKSIDLSFDNLAIPEVHLHTASDEENTPNDNSNSDTVEEKDPEDKTKKKSKPSISFDSVAIPEIHIKK